MSSKVRILSSDTPRLQLLEQVIESKHEEVLQLHSEADDLRRKHSSRKQNTRAAQSDLAHLKAEHSHHLSGVDDASISIIKLRTQLLASLGCGLADPGCIEAITAEKTEEFWTYMEKVKPSPTTTANVSRTHTEDLKTSMKRQESYQGLQAFPVNVGGYAIWRVPYSRVNTDNNNPVCDRKNSSCPIISLLSVHEKVEDTVVNTDDNKDLIRCLRSQRFVPFVQSYPI
ncbi:hypothetical protein GG344DRAFT_64756 [Lentinula edodes]|nr:hypothetical protein GG344DRAFT_64756 [Lentinula edodes]